MGSDITQSFNSDASFMPGADSTPPNVTTTSQGVMITSTFNTGIQSRRVLISQRKTTISNSKGVCVFIINPSSSFGNAVEFWFALNADSYIRLSINHEQTSGNKYLELVFNHYSLQQNKRVLCAFQS
ncbi:hypothetical protein AKO1_007933, partial [Acrasis kona]